MIVYRSVDNYRVDSQSVWTKSEFIQTTPLPQFISIWT